MSSYHKEDNYCSLPGPSCTQLASEAACCTDGASGAGCGQGFLASSDCTLKHWIEVYHNGLALGHDRKDWEAGSGMCRYIKVSVLYTYSSVLPPPPALCLVSVWPNSLFKAELLLMQFMFFKSIIVILKVKRCYTRLACTKILHKGVPYFLF